jgi:carbamoyltransferase
MIASVLRLEQPHDRNRMPMPKNHVYVLGINAYDHDVSACLLRDGQIACAINKERITRRKHDTGFFQEVVDYCLAAEGISLGDVDLVVRNCYVLPIEEMEVRSMYDRHRDREEEHKRAVKHPLFFSRSNNVMTMSHHLAHAYSAFAASPFEEGVVMIVDGVGSYAADVIETYPKNGINPLARESESYYRFTGSKIETLKKVWLEPARGALSDEFFFMAGLGAVYSRVSSYIFADWNNVAR